MTLARLPMHVDAVVESVNELAVAGRALAAVGVIDRTLAATIGTELALALVVRGYGELDFDAGEFGDIAAMVESVRGGGRVPSLVRVAVADDVVVEQWTDHARITNAGGEHVVAGEVDGPGGLASRFVRARIVPVDAAAYLDTLGSRERAIARAAFEACAAALLSLRNPVARPRKSSKAEAVAVVAIRDGRRTSVRTHGLGAIDAAWMRSDAGVHRGVVHLCQQHGPWRAFDVTHARVPSAGQLTLVLVAGGHAIEVDLR
jgi:hypothetical protein